MNVLVETQLLCIENNGMRGIPYYTRELINALKNDSRCTCYLSFFDYMQERNNRQKLINNLGETWEQSRLLECNTVSYKDIMENILDNNNNWWRDIPKYEDLFSVNADIVHFPHVQYVSRNVMGNVVVTVHDTLAIMDRFSSYFRPRLDRLAYLNNMKYIKERSDIQLVADSKATKDDVIYYCGIDESRITVSYLGVNRELFYKDIDISIKSKYKIDGPYILYLGALDPRKGIIDSIRAFNILKENINDIRFVISGNPLDRETKDLIDEEISNSKYQNDIILTGFVSDADKRKLLSLAELFLFPSEYEGFGLPVLEAMSCNCPVITTCASSLPEVGGNAARYVHPNNIEELSETIKELLDDEEKREIMKIDGLKQVDKFSWKKCAEQTISVYEKF